MDLRELLTRKGRQRFALERKIKKATSKWSQSAERMKAMYALAEDGSEAAIAGLVSRFGIQSDKSIDDEQEKEWVFDTLVAMGDRALPPIMRALRNAETISWPLRVAEKLLDRDKLWEAIEKQVLDTMEPGYERDPTRKIQLITYLGDTRDPRVAPAVAPYLEDQNETVRFTTVETLIRQRDEYGREPLLRLLVDAKEESLRTKARICEGLVDLGWDVRGFRGQAEKSLPNEFQLDGEGRVKRTRATA